MGDCVKPKISLKVSSYWTELKILIHFYKSQEF